MMVDMKRLVVELEPRGIIPMKDALGTRIECHCGRIWITEERSPDDQVLDPGDAYVVSRGGITVVQALHKARVGIRAPEIHRAGFRTWIERLYPRPVRTRQAAGYCP